MGTDILAQIRAAGITLSADGGNLVATPRAVITDDIRTLIREHKLALMAALAHPAADIIQANSTGSRTSPSLPKSAGSPTKPRLS